MKIRGLCATAALLLVSGAVSAQSLRWSQRIFGPPDAVPNTYLSYYPSTALTQTRPMLGWSAAGSPGVVTVGGYSGSGALVVKIAATDGSELWRSDLGDAGWPALYDVHVDAAGDIVIGGSVRGQQPPRDRWSVRKISGATGQSIWEYVAMPPTSSAGGDVDAIATDPDGDIVAVGRRRDETNAASFVIKLSGATGEPVWTTSIPDPVGFAPAQIATDAAGNTFVSPRGGVFVKLAPNGAPAWSIDLSQEPGLNACTTRALAVDPATGDVLVAGQANCGVQQPHGYAARIRTSDGDVTWIGSVGGTVASGATALVLDGAGKVLLAGGIGAIEDGQRWFAARLSLADGSADWSTLGIDSTLHAVADVAVGENGDVLLTGVCTAYAHCAASLAADTGTQRWIAQTGTAYAQGLENYSNAIIATGGGVFFGGKDEAGGHTTWTVHRLDDGDLFRNGFE